MGTSLASVSGTGSRVSLAGAPTSASGSWKIDTGALDRMMQDPPAPDDAGVIWTTWGASPGLRHVHQLTWATGIFARAVAATG